MKNLAKKSTKKAAIPDMTVKQFHQALTRHGMKLVGILGYVEMFDGKLSVSRLNGGKTLRSQLAYLLAQKDKFEAGLEAAEDVAVIVDDAIEVHEAPVEAVKAFDQVLAANPGHEGAVITTIRAGFTSHAVPELLAAWVTRFGATPAAELFQHSLRDCKQRVYVDGKIGHVTIKAVNRVPEPRLLAELQQQAKG